MKTRKFQNTKNTKFIRINNNTWIETKVWIPDDVAKSQFYQKMQLIKPGVYPAGAEYKVIRKD